MTKKRKTRSQKLLADQRHVIYHLDLPTQVSYPTEKKTIIKPVFAPQHSPKITFAYVSSDIKKTAFITAAIITLQVTLFFSMKNF